MKKIITILITVLLLIISSCSRSQEDDNFNMQNINEQSTEDINNTKILDEVNNEVDNSSEFVNFTTSVKTPIYSSPNIDSDIVAVVDWGTPIDVEDLIKKDDWYKVIYDSKERFIIGKSLCSKEEHLIYSENYDKILETKENEFVEIVSVEVNNSEVFPQFKNKSDFVQIGYEFIIIPYDCKGNCLVDDLKILSGDLITEPNELTHEGIGWKLNDNVERVEVCIGKIIYHDNGTEKNWYNPLVGEWLIEKSSSISN